MGQKIILSGVSFFFAAYYGTTHTRANTTARCRFATRPQPARIALCLPRHGVFIHRTGAGKTSFNASPDGRSLPR